MEEYGKRQNTITKIINKKIILSTTLQASGEKTPIHPIVPNMVRPVTILAFILYLLSGCSGKPSILDFDSAPLLGMIYDHSGRPVPAAKIFLEDGSKQESDINGRFILPNLSHGKHKIKIKKEGHESLKIDVSFFSRRQVLHIRLVSIDYLLSETVQAVAGNRIIKAKDLISRIEAGESGDDKDPYLLFLKAVFVYKQGACEEARNIVLRLSERGFNNKAVTSFLAILNK